MSNIVVGVGIEMNRLDRMEDMLAQILKRLDEPKASVTHNVVVVVMDETGHAETCYLPACLPNMKGQLQLLSMNINRL